MRADGVEACVQRARVQRALRRHCQARVQLARRLRRPADHEHDLLRGGSGSEQRAGQPDSETMDGLRGVARRHPSNSTKSDYLRRVKEFATEVNPHLDQKYAGADLSRLHVEWIPEDLAIVRRTCAIDEDDVLSMLVASSDALEGLAARADAVHRA